MFKHVTFEMCHIWLWEAFRRETAPVYIVRPLGCHVVVIVRRAPLGGLWARRPLGIASESSQRTIKEQLVRIVLCIVRHSGAAQWVCTMKASQKHIVHIVRPERFSKKCIVHIVQFFFKIYLLLLNIVYIYI